MADPNIKIGAGYIEISPRISGFNRTLTRKIKDELKEIGALDAVIKPTLDPKFTESLNDQLYEAIRRLDTPAVFISANVSSFGLRRDLEDVSRAVREAQNRIYFEPALVDGFTPQLVTLVETELAKLRPFEITVKAKLEDVTSFQDAVKRVTRSLRDAEDEASKSTKRIETDFDRSLSRAREAIRKLDIAIRAGFQGLNDPQTAVSIDRLRDHLVRLSVDIDGLSSRQVASIRAGMREIEAMTSRVDRAVEAEARVVAEAEAAKRRERERTEQELIQSYKLQESIARAVAREEESLVREVASVKKATLVEIQLAEKEAARAKAASDKAAQAAMAELERETAKLFAEIDKTSKATDKLIVQSNRSVVSAAKSILSFDGQLNKGFKALDKIVEEGLNQASSSVQKGGASLGSQFVATFQNVVFGMLARGGIIGAAIALLGTPIVAGLANLAAGLIAVGSSGAYALGSLAALPAVFALMGQGIAVLLIGMQGIEDALNALGAADDKSGASAQAAAQAREAAAERVRSAQERLADAQRTSAASVEAAQARLTSVQEQAAARVVAAQQRVVDAQEQVADAAEAAAQRALEAQERVADAQERLVDVQEQAAQRVADAQRRLAEVQASSVAQIVSAEGRLADSHRRTAEALADLNQARLDAAERLEDLALAEASAALDEEAAQLAIERAAERLHEINTDPKADPRDRREADLAYRQAVQRLKEIKERNEDLRKEVEEANKAGVEGSREVTRARERIRDAQDAEIEAEKELSEVRKEAAESAVDAENDLLRARRDAAGQVADAQKQLARAERDLSQARLDGAKQVEAAQERVLEAERALALARQEGTKDIAAAEAGIAQAREDGARQVERAQRDLTQALKSQQDAINQVSTQAQNAEVALSKLSPAGRRFVLFLHEELIPKLRDVQWSIQDAFLPPIEDALRRSEPLLGTLRDGLSKTGEIVGGLAGKFIDWMNTPFFTGRVKSIMNTNNQLFVTLEEAAEKLGEGLLILTDSAGPFLKWIVDIVNAFSTWFANTMKQTEASGELAKFWEEVQKTLTIVISIVSNLARAFGNVFQIAKPHGDDVLKLIQDLSKEFADWTESVEGKAGLEKFFENGKNVLKEVILLFVDLGKLFFDLGKDVDLSSVVKDIREDLLPAIKELIMLLAGEEGGTLSKAVNLLSIAFGGINGTTGMVGTSFNLLTLNGKGVESSLKSLLGGADTFVRGIAKFFGVDMPYSSEEARKAIDKLAKGWGDNTDKMKKLLSDFAKHVTDKFADLRRDLPKKVDELGEWLKKSWTDVAAKIGENISRSIEAIKKWWSDLPQWVHTLFTALGLVLQQKLGPFYDIGKQILTGIWNGLASGWQGFTDWVSRGIDNLIDSVKRMLGINSPSRVFMSVGASIGEGLVVGIRDRRRAVSNATLGLVAAVTDAWDTPQLGIGVQVGAIPTPGATAVNPAALRPVDAGGEQRVDASRVYNVTLNAAPTVPTEKQLVSTLSYVDVLYS